MLSGWRLKKYNKHLLRFNCQIMNIVMRNVKRKKNTKVSKLCNQTSQFYLIKSEFLTGQMRLIKGSSKSSKRERGHSELCDITTGYLYCWNPVPDLERCTTLFSIYSYNSQSQTLHFICSLPPPKTNQRWQFSIIQSIPPRQSTRFHKTSRYYWRRCCLLFRLINKTAAREMQRH